MADTYRETKSRFTWIGEIEDERLLSALEKLKEEDLKILTLYAYDGYTVTEISKVLRCSQPTISIKIPKEQIVTKRYEKENAERKNHLQDLQTQRNKAEKDLFALKTEVLACIKGESVLPRETLAEMITAQEEKLTELENLCEAASEELEKTAELMDKVSRLYDELISYADLYDSANFEAKKMVVNQLIRRVDVYRGYQINISFNFDLTPYIEGE